MACKMNSILPIKEENLWKMFLGFLRNQGRMEDLDNDFFYVPAVWNELNGSTLPDYEEGEISTIVSSCSKNDSSA